MTPYDIAQGYIGTSEAPGAADNPVIMKMYATIGQTHIEHDEVAWCAAFVGHCLETAGLRSTRKLNARSYLKWGVPVELSEAQPGDIVVFRRGSSAWQGHVGFLKAQSGASIEVLGGNQGDAVNVKRYPAAKLLGVRRAGNVAPRVILSVTEVQHRLKSLGYHEVGAVDGKIGPRTEAAILAFRNDNALPRVPVIDVALTDALQVAKLRAISQERATGAPRESRILSAANAQIGLGAIGAAGSVASQIAPALAEAEQARDVAGRFFSLIGLETWLAAALPWIGAACFFGVILYALRARAARIDDHRTGKTP